MAAIPASAIARPSQGWNSSPSSASSKTKVEPFPSTGPLPSVASVGGKGFSLIRMANAGIAVPPGFVLTTAFFKEWIDKVMVSENWALFLAHSNYPDSVEAKRACILLKQFCHDALSFTPSQKALVDQSLVELKAKRRSNKPLMFAVRSSSPEEDLEGASFAGGYETVLGVVPEKLQSAVISAFASCFDIRVVAYKRLSGFDVNSPSIAIVVQTQLNCAVAGVAFSVNPINNSLDEVVINANFGLGESVVSGEVSPDQFIVNKFTNKIDKTLGKKENAVWLGEGGGTVDRAVDPKNFTLTEAQVLELVDQLAKIEPLYQNKPIDIEFGVEDEQLFLLQCRPITTHLPIPIDLLTPPMSPIHVYFDATISIQGLFKPMSVMGTDAVKALLELAHRKVLSIDPNGGPYRKAFAVASPSIGKIMIKASGIASVGGVDNVKMLLGNFDQLALSAFEVALDSKQNWAPLSLSKFGLALGSLFGGRARTVAWNLFWYQRDPKWGKANVEAKLTTLYEKLDQWDKERVTRAISPLQLKEALCGVIVEGFLALLPALLTWRLTRGYVRDLFGPNPPEEVAKAIEKLDLSLPGNVTIAMSVALDEFSQLFVAHMGTLVVHSPHDLDKILNQDKSAPAPVQSAWEKFLATYGHRGDTELDFATPRFTESNETLLSQVYSEIATAKEGKESLKSASKIHGAGVKQREEAYAFLLKYAQEKLGASAASKFQGYYEVIISVGGLRESPKFMIIKMLHVLRKNALEWGRMLTDLGRIDEPNHIFDFLHTDIESALSNSLIDLRKLRDERLSLLRAWSDHAEQPRIIDSRGRIYRPKPLPAKEGELAGSPISPGTYRGYAKVLHSPHEKPLNKGEILVARATNPGWTPLFSNAGAIVLEVGGMLQHGALVGAQPFLGDVLDVFAH